MEQKFLEEETKKESLGEKIFNYVFLSGSVFLLAYWIMQNIGR